MELDLNILFFSIVAYSTILYLPLGVKVRSKNQLARQAITGENQRKVLINFSKFIIFPALRISMWEWELGFLYF